MASPYQAPVPAGTNTNLSSAPGFTQSLGGELSTPAVQARPKLERLEQLRGLIGVAGQAISGAISSEARIAAIAKARTQERQHEINQLHAIVKQQQAEADNERQAAYRSAMTERLKNIQRHQFDILRDDRSTNQEWVMEQAVIARNNAQYPEERDGWMDFIVQHQNAARQDAKMEAEKISRVANAQLITDRRIASKTARNAIDDLKNEIELDAEQKMRLIGDGKGINERVNEFVLQSAMQAAPELFNINKKDPLYESKMEQQRILIEELEHNAQTTIVSPLRDQFISNTNKSNETAGADRLEIATQSFADGDMDKSEFHNLVGDTLNTNFKHVDPKQRDQIREKLYRQVFDDLANLRTQTDIGKAAARMDDLLSIADLNPNERKVIEEKIISDKFPKAVKDQLEQRFQTKIAEMTGITRLNDGGTIVPQDMRAVTLDAKDNGTFRDIAGQVLDSLGIGGDPSTLTPLQNNLLAVVTQATIKAEQAAAAHEKKANASVERASRFLSGSALTGDEPTQQWNDGALMRMFTGNLSSDDPVYQSMASTYKARTGKDFPWDGTGPIPVNADTLPILKDVAQQEGAAWGRNSMVNVPAALSKTIENMVLYDSPEKMAVAINFWEGLGIEGQQRVGSTLNAQSQMVMMEASRLYGSSPQGHDLNLTEIRNSISTITQNTAVAALRKARDQAGVGDVTPNPSFHYDYAKSVAKAIGEHVLRDGYGAEVPGFNVDVQGDGFGDASGSGALQGLNSLIGNQALVPLFAQMSLIQQANPQISLDQAAIVATAYMRQSGFKVVDGTLGKQIVKDKWDHYPTNVTPSVLLQQKLSQTLTEEQSRKVLARLPNVGPETKKMARAGTTYADILWSYMSENTGNQQGALPHPREWAFTPLSTGEVFTGSMASEDGGIPMEVTIPGIGRTQLPLDVNGNPLLVVSKRRPVVTPNPVDQNSIPDYFLTTQARRKVKLKPDSSQTMTELIQNNPFGQLGHY